MYSEKKARISIVILTTVTCEADNEYFVQNEYKLKAAEGRNGYFTNCVNVTKTIASAHVCFKLHYHFKSKTIYL